jgi:hypothetical protein
MRKVENEREMGTVLESSEYQMEAYPFVTCLEQSNIYSALKLYYLVKPEHKRCSYFSFSEIKIF